MLHNLQTLGALPIIGDAGVSAAPVVGMATGDVLSGVA